MAVAAVVVGLLTLAGAGFALKDKALEEWYIWELESENQEVRKNAAEKLGEMRAVRAIPRLMELCPEDKEYSEKRAQRETTYIMDALVKIGKPAVPALVRKLQYGRIPWCAWSARYALGRIGSPAIPALIAALRDEDEYTRHNAALTLGELPLGPLAKDAVPALMETLADENLSVRRVAADALGYIGDVIGAPALSAMLKDDNKLLRYSAAWALSKPNFPAETCRKFRG